ncbi:MAG: hypothetical protein J6334_03810, partial [Kiritimatiellae bacterium]|nr:hypothetical protein [Kiritimatiellia bacterium]
MNPVKNGLVWGSIFRHALALCLAVPFAVKADTAFNWGSSGDFDSVTGFYNDADPDNIVFSATLTQTETITLSQTSATFSQIALDGRRNSGFSEQFISQLLAIDRNLPYAEWSLSSVLIEIESASVSG